MRVIDSEKCVGCGLCVNDCVSNYLILAIQNGKKIAGFKERGRCIECGHCNAICPNMAITGGNHISLDENRKADSLLYLMTCKRTVRQYIKGAEIPSDSIDKIILAGQSAPTDRNRKSAKIIFVKKSLPFLYNMALNYLVEEVQKTGNINPIYVPTMRLNDKRDEVLWNAEYLVVIAGSRQSVVDASIAAERMQLEASNLEIGTAYRGDILKALNSVQQLKDLLEIKTNEEALVCFAMGKTNLKYFRETIKINRKVIYK